MHISPFIFLSEKLPKLKAKQLFKAFQFFKLSTAQEATARALGYSSWYECANRGTAGEPSLTDQEAGLETRAVRYNHQAGVLMALGVTPSEADLWVRTWGLTGRPTLAPEEGVPLYFRWSQAVIEDECNELSEEQAAARWPNWNSKYLEVDRPLRVCPGVILGPYGKYPHYAVDPAINAQIPIYMRGPYPLYHYEDDGDVLAMTIAEFPKQAWQIKQGESRRLNPIQHEWHYGKKHSASRRLLLPELEAAALEVPDSMVVISQRAMPTADGSYSRDLAAVACLRGRDFAAFLRAKGSLDTSTVIWYRDVKYQFFDLEDSLHGAYADQALVLPIFTEAKNYAPSAPLYSYPFMTAPMHSDEYGTLSAGALLPLHEDYLDGDGNDGNEEEWTIDPTGAVAGSNMHNSSPAFPTNI